MEMWESKLRDAWYGGAAGGRGEPPTNLTLRIDRTQAGSQAVAWCASCRARALLNIFWPLELGPALNHSDRTTMAYIPYVPYEDAEGLLAELYGQYGQGAHGVDNILRIHSLNPGSMRDHVGLYVHLMRGRSPLTKTQREMVAVTVSALNDCFY